MPYQCCSSQRQAVGGEWTGCKGSVFADGNEGVAAHELPPARAAKYAIEQRLEQAAPPAVGSTLSGA